MLQAKAIIDRVSMSAAKTQVFRKIEAGEVFTKIENFKKPFSELTFKEQQSIAAVLGEADDGYFMDLLNLFKRANIAYVRAYYLRAQQEGDLLGRDIEAIREKLFEAYEVSIFIQDRYFVDPYILFDSEVANDFQQEIFNRELIGIMLSIPELELNEEKIEIELQTRRQIKRQEHWRSLAEEQIVSHQEFDVCVTWLEIEGPLSRKEKEHCFNKTKEKDFENASALLSHCWFNARSDVPRYYEEERKKTYVKQQVNKCIEEL